MLCDLFARGAVHAAMGGKTGVIIGLLHDMFIHVPIEMVVKKRSGSVLMDRSGTRCWPPPVNPRFSAEGPQGWLVIRDHSMFCEAA